jgi:formate dehydrogenase maturation protein FdhE
MSNVGDIQPDPGAIGSVVQPPFAQLPDPARVFAKRAERFRAVADDHQIESYHQQTNPPLGPVADDVASLGLDLLVRKSGIRRGSFNPYLLGYG